VTAPEAPNIDIDRYPVSRTAEDPGLVHATAKQQIVRQARTCAGAAPHRAHRHDMSSVCAMRSCRAMVARLRHLAPLRRTMGR